MSKQFLQSVFSKIENDNYVWSLYFFRIDHRGRQQPYLTYKVRFKNNTYLPTYANSLINATRRFQIEPLSCVQDYDGENTKVTCDKISVENALISEQWNSFFNSVSAATDKKIKGSLQGYILTGQPTNSELIPITFVKIANPITKVNSKKSIVFTDSNDELDLMSDDVYRLYLTVDFIVLNKVMYTFNHSFEKLFNIEKTMSRVKTAAIESIINTNGISNSEDFHNYAKQYSSARTFITLNDERLERIKDEEKRIEVAKKLCLKVDESNKNIIVEDFEQASRLIHYLCYKLFVDKETDDLLEATTVTKVSL